MPKSTCTPIHSGRILELENNLIHIKFNLWKIKWVFQLTECRNNTEQMLHVTKPWNRESKPNKGKQKLYKTEAKED